MALTPELDYDSSWLRRFHERLRLLAGERTYDWWFNHHDNLQISADRVVAWADSEFELRRFQRDGSSVLRTVVDELIGKDCLVDFQLRPSKPEDKIPLELGLPRIAVRMPMSNQTIHEQPMKQAQRKSEKRTSAAGELDSETRAQPCSLSQFQYGQNNELARVSIEQALQTPGQYSPLLLVGPNGCGKTHLLEGLVHRFGQQSKSQRCVYLTAEQFTNSFVQALRGAGLPMFRRKYRDLQLLAIDDIQFFAGKKATINELQYTIDQLTRSGRQIVFASDRPPIELTEFGPELMTRCTAGLVCPLQYPDLQARRAIVEQMCRQRGLAIEPDAQDLLASQITRDVRRLSGAVNRLRAAMLSQPAENRVTVAMCQLTLQDLLTINHQSTSLSKIDQVVCEMCGVHTDDLKSDNRGKKVSTARMLAMWLSRRYTNSALSEIGQYFGGRSHSTVIAAEKRVASWIDRRDNIPVVNTSYPVCDMVQRIESKLRIG